MARPKGAVPKQLYRVYIETPVSAQMETSLFSEVEKRVPHGKLSEFVNARLKEHFEWETLDLTPYGFASNAFVRGPKVFLLMLKNKLEAKA